MQETGLTPIKQEKPRNCATTLKGKGELNLSLKGKGWNDTEKKWGYTL
jgi:hypothetical protein